MVEMTTTHPIPWLDGDEIFPAVNLAWGHNSPAPGLLAASKTLKVQTLIRAYEQGIFPWYSKGQPTLWWSPDPRMVLHPGEFRLHRSLAKLIHRFRTSPDCEIRMNSHFDAVIHACSISPRAGQSGTWITSEIQQAYGALHRANLAHSVETWIGGKLVAGLYCVNIGGAVFGESMFTTVTDGSKLALAALTAFCIEHDIPMIDCQQNTKHLASMGAREIRREDFLRVLHLERQKAAPSWAFNSLYWDHVIRLR
jgi:leucyl/phenylalanyl-tRNA--protein transferase